MSDFLPQPKIAPPGVWRFPTPSRARLEQRHRDRSPSSSRAST